jgi:hypothetical protein
VIRYHTLILQEKKLFAKRSLVGFVLSPLTPENEVPRTQQTEKRETGKGEGVHKDLQRKTKQQIKLGGSYHTMYYVL